MKLFKVEIPKNKLDTIPENEVVFFVQIGSLLNDISMLQKLVIFSMNKETDNDTERTAQNLQAMGLLRLQAGKLNEGWILLQKHFFGAQISKLYEPKLDEKAQESLGNLKAYFNSTNIIFKIRNEFAFHYPYKETITETLKSKSIPDGTVFQVFMSEYFGNCIFSMSNVLITTSILDSIGCTNRDEAMGKWVKETIMVSKWFGDFLGECLKVFAESHIGFKSSEVEIPEPMNLNEIDLPYFIKGNE